MAAHRISTFIGIYIHWMHYSNEIAKKSFSIQRYLSSLEQFIEEDGCCFVRLCHTYMCVFLYNIWRRICEWTRGKYILPINTREIDQDHCIRRAQIKDVQSCTYGRTPSHYDSVYTISFVCGRYTFRPPPPPHHLILCSAQSYDSILTI